VTRDLAGHPRLPVGSLGSAAPVEMPTVCAAVTGGARMEAVAMETPARGFPRGAIRVSDAERDAAVAELSQHYQTGRLTADEFSERSGQALEARTGDQLHALFDDLPPVAAGSPPPEDAGPVMTTVPAAVQPPRRPGPGRTVAVFIVGYVLVGNLLSALVNATSADWSSALGAIIPALLFGLIFLRLIRPLRHRRRR